MDRGVSDDEFLDLCQQYAELVKAKEKLLALETASDAASLERRADEIDDFDARQRILMWRILCCGEQDQAESAEPEMHAANDAQPVRRPMLREIAGLFSNPFRGPSARYG